MCTLPNFEAWHLEELRQNRKRENKKAEAKTVKIVVPEQQLLENPI
jgi:hypothetical protein